MSVWRGPFPFGRAKLLLSRTPVGSLDRAFRLEPRAFGRAKLLLSRIIRLSPTDLLSSPAGKLGRRLVTTHGSAGASPSRVWVVRLGGSLALPSGVVSARREPRPPECGVVRLGGSLALPSVGCFGSSGASPSRVWVVRLGGSLALPSVGCFGSAGASPSRVWVVRLGGSLALPRWGCAARPEPRPPEWGCAARREPRPPEMRLCGSAGASPSRDAVVRLAFGCLCNSFFSRLSWLKDVFQPRTTFGLEPEPAKCNRYNQHGFR